MIVAAELQPSVVHSLQLPVSLVPAAQGPHPALGLLYLSVALTPGLKVCVV